MTMDFEEGKVDERICAKVQQRTGTKF